MLLKVLGVSGNQASGLEQERPPVPRLEERLQDELNPYDISWDCCGSTGKQDGRKPDFSAPTFHRRAYLCIHSSLLQIQVMPRCGTKEK